jgi:hypothetical protein
MGRFSSVITRKTYDWQSEMIETDYGPENQLIISHNGERVKTYRECMDDQQILVYFGTDWER